MSVRPGDCMDRPERCLVVLRLHSEAARAHLAKISYTRPGSQTLPLSPPETLESPHSHSRTLPASPLKQDDVPTKTSQTQWSASSGPHDPASAPTPAPAAATQLDPTQLDLTQLDPFLLQPLPWTQAELVANAHIPVYLTEPLPMVDGGPNTDSSIKFGLIPISELPSEALRQVYPRASTPPPCLPDPVEPPRSPSPPAPAYHTIPWDEWIDYDAYLAQGRDCTSDADDDDGEQAKEKGKSDSPST